MLIFPDNTVFVHFAEIGRVDLLEQLFAGKAQWTATVAEECRLSSLQPHLSDLVGVPDFMGRALRPSSQKEIVDVLAIRQSFAGPDDHERKNLGEAETLSIILNRQLDAWLITDDKQAYGYAGLNGIKALTTWDVLKLSQKYGLIDAPAAWGYVLALGGPRTRYPELRTRGGFENWCTSSTSLGYLP